MAMKVLSSPGRGVRFIFRKISLKIDSVKQIFQIGFPASLTQVLNPIGLAILILIVSKTYLEPGATAFSLVFLLEFFAYLPAVGFSMAAMSMIAQNMGSDNSQRALEVFQKSKPDGACFCALSRNRTDDFLKKHFDAFYYGCCCIAVFTLVCMDCSAQLWSDCGFDDSRE